jgi:hypothetical protein
MFMHNRTLWWWALPVGLILVMGGVWFWTSRGRTTSKPEPTVQVPPTVTTPPPVTPKPPEPTPPPPVVEPKRPSEKEALVFMEKFMATRQNGDLAGVQNMLAVSLSNKAAVRVSLPDARITGYMIDPVASLGNEPFAFRVRVGIGYKGAGGDVDVEDVKVAWTSGFKVSQFEPIVKETLALSVAKDGNLYLARGQDTALAGALSLLPAKASPYGAGPNIQFGVGKDGWSVAVPSYSGSYVLWVTRGLHPLLGVTQVKWGGAPTIVPLDLLFEAGVTEAAWAPVGAKYVAIAIAQPSGAVMLQVWDIGLQTRLSPDLATAMGTMDFMIKNLRWASPTQVEFDLQKAGVPQGLWRYDVASKQLSPPES